MTVKNRKGEFVTQHKARPGPTALLLTTTATALEPELETRVLFVPTDESSAQTAASLRAFARSQRQPYLLKALQPWIELQQWLAGHGSSRVVVPYARTLAGLFTAATPRARRDFSKVLTLVQAIALLHQATRHIEHGVVKAKRRDYRAAYELLQDLVAEQTGARVPPHVRRVVNVVQERILRGVTAPSKSEIHADVPERVLTSVARAVDRAVELGYLRYAEAGRTSRVALDEPMPDDKIGLPTPEALRDALRRKRRD
ncbi:MAG: hypothetical protein FJ028_04245 [Chloroflexi bacterium]|nr:hypothetical protein [Chloroflexota bacterium]